MAKTIRRSTYKALHQKLDAHKGKGNLLELLMEEAVSLLVQRTQHGTAAQSVDVDGYGQIWPELSHIMTMCALAQDVKTVAKVSSGPKPVR